MRPLYLVFTSAKVVESICHKNPKAVTLNFLYKVQCVEVGFDYGTYLINDTRFIIIDSNGNPLRVSKVHVEFDINFEDQNLAFTPVYAIASTPAGAPTKFYYLVGKIDAETDKYILFWQDYKTVESPKID